MFFLYTVFSRPWGQVSQMPAGPGRSFAENYAQVSHWKIVVRSRLESLEKEEEKFIAGEVYSQDLGKDQLNIKLVSVCF